MGWTVAVSVLFLCSRSSQHCLVLWCRFIKHCLTKRGIFPKNLNVAGAQLQIFSCKLSVHKTLSLAGV